MFVDFLLLLCVKRIIHSNIKNYRLIISSIIGAVFSFTAFIPFNQFPVNLLINIFSLIILSLICFGFKNKTQFIKNTSILLVVSFLFSGAMLYLYSAFRPDGMVVINNVVYFNISPLFFTSLIKKHPPPIDPIIRIIITNAIMFFLIKKEGSMLLIIMYIINNGNSSNINVYTNF